MVTLLEFQHALKGFCKVTLLILTYSVIHSFHARIAQFISALKKKIDMVLGPSGTLTELEGTHRH